MTEIEQVSCSKAFGGWQKVFSHESKELKCKMNFGIFLPAEAEEHPLPIIYYLSGLECNEVVFAQKAGAQRYAAEHKVIIVTPDTSPRGLNLPGENDTWDFGSGAGYYINATKEPWKTNYRMYNYVTKELLELVNEKFPVIPGEQSIMGHSMGGHGALICALKNPYLYKSVSAFAPVCNPSKGTWGRKVFTGYLGENEEEWAEWDSTELAKTYKGPTLPILIDQGTKDQFMRQLLPENFVAVTRGADWAVTYRSQEEYDHGYYFVATFVEDHIKHHMKYLKKGVHSAL